MSFRASYLAEVKVSPLSQPILIMKEGARTRHLGVGTLLLSKKPQNDEYMLSSLGSFLVVFSFAFIDQNS